MKLTRQIEDKKHQKDLRIWIRDDFKINKNLSDEVSLPDKSLLGRNCSYVSRVC